MATTSEKGSPYRGGSSSGPPPLAFRYVPCVWYAPLVPVFFLVGTVWASRGEAGLQLLTHLGAGLLLGAIIAAMGFPVVSVRARVEAGEVIVTGYRWPGVETVWSCAIKEAERFEAQTVEGRLKKERFLRLALRTTAGQVLPLTETAWPGGTWLYPKLVARLNAWLHEATTHTPAK